MAQRKRQRFSVHGGAKIGDWLVLAPGSPNRHGAPRMFCRCERCGIEKLVLRYNLTTGESRGCGCLRRQLMIESRAKHGHAPRGAKSKTWRAWRDMKRRYGEERVCREWWASFETFIADVGEKPSPNHRLHVQRGRPLLPSTVSWVLKRSADRTYTIHRARDRVRQAEAKRAAEQGAAAVGV